MITSLTNVGFYPGNPSCNATAPLARTHRVPGYVPMFGADTPGEGVEKATQSKHPAKTIGHAWGRMWDDMAADLKLRKRNRIHFLVNTLFNKYVKKGAFEDAVYWLERAMVQDKRNPDIRAFAAENCLDWLTQKRELPKTVSDPTLQPFVDVRLPALLVLP